MWKHLLEMEGVLTSSEIPHANCKSSEDTEMVFCVSLGIMGRIAPASCRKKTLFWEGSKLAGQSVGCHGLHSRGKFGCDKRWPILTDQEEFWVEHSLKGARRNLYPEFDFFQLHKAHLNSGGLFPFSCLYNTEAYWEFLRGREIRCGLHMRHFWRMVFAFFYVG